MPNTLTTCSCGRRYTIDEYERLPFVALWHTGGAVLWLVNCEDCGSTMAVVLGPVTTGWLEQEQEDAA